MYKCEWRQGRARTNGPNAQFSVVGLTPSNSTLRQLPVPAGADTTAAPLGASPSRVHRLAPAIVVIIRPPNNFEACCRCRPRQAPRIDGRARGFKQSRRYRRRKIVWMGLNRCPPNQVHGEKERETGKENDDPWIWVMMTLIHLRSRRR